MKAGALGGGGAFNGRMGAVTVDGGDDEWP